MDNRVKLLNQLVEHIDEQSAYVDEFKKLFNCSVEDDRYNSLMGDYIELLAGAIGCESTEYLYWFIYDNDSGRKGLKAGVDSNMREIKTVEDFLWFMDTAYKYQKEIK